MNNDKRIIARVTRTLKALMLGVMVVAATSCEDFLTISPTDKIVLEDFWKSKSDVDNVVAESYRLMTQFDFTSRLLVWGELRGDNVIAGNNVGTEIENILEANILPTNSYASWAPFYKVINNCNIVLKYAPGVLDEDPDFTEGDLAVVRGQMLALRALCHFYLVRTFRDIPLLVEAKVDDSQFLYEKQVDPVVALDTCLNDLFEAENLVLTSGNYTNREDNKGRITKDAVRAIIADVYLWKAAFLAQKADGDDSGAQVQECYTACAKYCDLVLDARMAYAEKQLADNPDDRIVLYDFPLVYAKLETDPDHNPNRFPHYPYDALFGGSSSPNFGDGCNSPYESIFELQHATRSETGNYEVPYFYGSVQDGNVSVFTVGLLSASRYLAVLKGGLYKRTDFRRVDYINSQAAEDENAKFGIIKYGHSATKEDRGDATKENFGKMSYTFLKSNTSGGMRYFSEDYVNWIVYRISDVMLMKAEALAFSASGEQALYEAYKLVEAVYNRSQVGFKLAGVPIGNTFLEDYDFLNENDYVGLNNKKNLQRLILDERQREFAFEGKRWYDLVRMAVRQNSTDEMLDIFIDNKYAANQDEYEMKMSKVNSLFFPIAEREIDTHPGLNQNDAYGTDEKYEQN